MTSLELVQIMVGNNTTMHEKAEALDAWLAERMKAASPREGFRDPAHHKAILEIARKQHEREGELEIDDDAEISEGRDNGVYVNAWVWVSFEGTVFDRKGERLCESCGKPTDRACDSHCLDCKPIR